MKSKLIFILFSAIFFTSSVFAQQLLNDNQYLYNRFSLSPVYTGYTGHTEVFAGFRQSWLGVQGAPEYKNINLNAARNEKMGFGVTISSDKTGIFEQFNAQLSYGYHVKFNNSIGLHFGVNAGLYNNRIDIASIYTSSNNDPIALSFQDYHGTAFDAGLGIMLNYDKLNIGVSLPRVLGTKIIYDEDYNLKYTLARHYQAHASYHYEMKDWTVEPIVVVSMAAKTPLFYEAAVNLNYKKTVWVSAQYKKGNIFGAGVGAALGERFIANYSYEFGNSGMYAVASGSHEISVGFLLKYNESIVHPPSIFADNKSLRLKEITENRSKENEAQIRKLKKEIKKLQAQLEKCCKESDEMKVLKEKIEMLEIELKDQASTRASQLEYDKAFVLENINFEVNSNTLKSSSHTHLDVLAAKMKERPAFTLKIVGYTDNIGSDSHNLLLSKKRALAVKNYLVSQGIAAHRIVALGRGKENPIASNSTKEGRAKNRRIEVSFSGN